MLALPGTSAPLVAPVTPGTEGAALGGAGGGFVNQRSVPNSAAIVVSERTWEDGIPGLYVQFLKRKVLTQLKSKLLRGLAGGRAVRRPSGVCGERDGIKVLPVARGCPRPSPVPAPAPPLASRQLPRCTHAASLSF